jgi:hypothetical protein
MWRCAVVIGLLGACGSGSARGFIALNGVPLGDARSSYGCKSSSDLVDVTQGRWTIRLAGDGTVHISDGDHEDVLTAGPSCEIGSYTVIESWGVVGVGRSGAFKFDCAIAAGRRLTGRMTLEQCSL